MRARCSFTLVHDSSLVVLNTHYVARPSSAHRASRHRSVQTTRNCKKLVLRSNEVRCLQIAARPVPRLPAGGLGERCAVSSGFVCPT